MSASLLVSCVGVTTCPRLCPITKETALAAPTFCTDYGPNGWDGTASVEAFNRLKDHIANSVVVSIDNTVPFVVETDASDHATTATLNQSGRPVVFFSRNLSGSEQRHSAVEKEAYTIVEALRRWRHYYPRRR